MKESDGADTSHTSPRPGPEELELAILGEEPVYSAADVAGQTGVTIDEARRLWRALGFPDRGLEVAFTAADADAVSTLVGQVEAGLIDFDMAVTLTRAVGQTMAKLADWEVATLVHRVQEIEASAQATGSRARAGMHLIQEMGEPFERLLVYVWRRHLAAAVTRVEALGADDSDLQSTQMTIGFADIIGFTELSNELTQSRIGDLVELFESRCADVVATPARPGHQDAGRRGAVREHRPDPGLRHRRGDHQRGRPRRPDARRPGRPGQRLGRDAAR